MKKHKQISDQIYNMQMFLPMSSRKSPRFKYIKERLWKGHFTTQVIMTDLCGFANLTVKERKNGPT